MVAWKWDIILSASSADPVYDHWSVDDINTENSYSTMCEHQKFAFSFSEFSHSALVCNNILGVKECKTKVMWFKSQLAPHSPPPPPSCEIQILISPVNFATKQIFNKIINGLTNGPFKLWNVWISQTGFLHSVFCEESYRFYLIEFEVLPIEWFQSKNNNDKSNKAVALVHFFEKYQLWDWTQISHVLFNVYHTRKNSIKLHVFVLFSGGIPPGPLIRD